MCNHELEKRHSEKEQFLEFGAVYNLNIDFIKSDRPTIFQVGEDLFFFYPSWCEKLCRTATNSAKESAFEWRKIEKFRLGLRSYILLYVAKCSLQLIGYIFLHFCWMSWILDVDNAIYGVSCESHSDTKHLLHLLQNWI